MANDISTAAGYAMQSAATIAGAAMASADSRAGRKFNAEQAQINREYQTAEREAVQQYNLDMWNKTNEWNLAQWQRQNEYDSPQAQLERARQAGINPNTAIGSMYGNRSSNVSASAPTSTPMSGSLAQYSDGLPSALMSSISELGVQTANMLNTLADKDTKEYWLSYDQSTEEQRKTVLKAQAVDILKDIELKDVNIATANVVLSSLAEYREQELLNLRAICKKNQSETRSIDSAIVRDDALAQSTIDTNESMQSLNNQQQLESEARTDAQSFVNNFAKELGFPPGTPEYLFIKKLYDENKLSDFIDGAYARLERIKWTPNDRIVNIESDKVSETDYASKVDASAVGVGYSKDDTERNKTRSYSRKTYRYNDDGTLTVINP